MDIKKDVEAMLREEDLRTGPGAVLMKVLEQVERITEEQKAAVEAFQAKIPQIVWAELDASIQKLDNAAPPYGVFQKLRAISGLLEKNTLTAHDRMVAHFSEVLENELPAMIDRAILKHQDKIGELIEQKIGALIMKKLEEIDQKND